MNQTDKLQKFLGEVFDSCQDESSADHDQRRHDFVFHMTDWKADLLRFADLVRHPEKIDSADASEFVIGFLYHVVPHLNAAGRMLLDRIPDPFAEEYLATTKTADGEPDD